MIPVIAPGSSGSDGDGGTSLSSCGRESNAGEREVREAGPAKREEEEEPPAWLCREAVDRDGVKGGMSGVGLLLLGLLVDEDFFSFFSLCACSSFHVSIASFFNSSLH